MVHAHFDDCRTVLLCQAKQRLGTSDLVVEIGGRAQGVVLL